jgi:hypothetical protein
VPQVLSVFNVPIAELFKLPIVDIPSASSLFEFREHCLLDLPLFVRPFRQHVSGRIVGQLELGYDCAL